MGWIKSPRGGVCCDCQPAVCDPCNPTPCDLSEADDTVLDATFITDLTGTPPSSSLFGNYGVMRFKAEYLDGCFNYDVVTGSFSCPGLSYTTMGHEIYYSGGGHHFQLNQVGLDRTNVQDVAGCPAQAASCADVAGADSLDFLHNGGDITLKFTGWGGYGTTVRHNGSPNNPQWQLRRTRRFAYTFAASGKIKDYAVFADGRWHIIYSGQTTADLAFTASAGDVQTALNALANITSEGGVTVSGSLSSGWTITWNANGNRVQVTTDVSTVSIGWRFTNSTLTPGDSGTAEVQKVLLEFGCATCATGSGLTEWDGTFTVEDITDFDLLKWRATSEADQGTLKLNEQKLYLAEVRFSTTLGSLTPTGCGWILTIACMNGSGDFVLEWEGIKGSGTDWPGVYGRTHQDVGDGIMCHTSNGPSALEIIEFP